MLAKLNVRADQYDADQQTSVMLNKALQRTLAQHGVLISIAGAKHANYSDYDLFFAPIAGRLGITGAIDPYRAIEIINTCTLAFFNQHLLGQPSLMLEQRLSPYSEMKFETVTSQP